MPTTLSGVQVMEEDCKNTWLPEVHNNNFSAGIQYMVGWELSRTINDTQVAVEGRSLEDSQVNGT